MKPTRVEVVVLGGGKAGKSLAIDLGKEGIQTVLIERSAEMIGGSCINVACIPTKTFITSARVAQTVRRAPEFGIHTGEVKVEWAEMRLRTEKVVAAMREMNHKNMTAPAALKLVIGSGRFVAPKTVEVRHQNEVIGIFEAEKIFINTGTRPAQPLIAGIEQVEVFHSETIQRIPELPRHLVSNWRQLRGTRVRSHVSLSRKPGHSPGARQSTSQKGR